MKRKYKRKFSTKFYKGFRRCVYTMFAGLLILIFIAGSEIHINYNVQRAKKNIWDKVERVARIIRSLI